MFRSNKRLPKSLVWEALRQLAVAWPMLKTARMAFFNGQLARVPQLTGEIAFFVIFWGLGGRFSGKAGDLAGWQGNLRNDWMPLPGLQKVRSRCSEDLWR
jgi:hypothetical protein